MRLRNSLFLWLLLLVIAGVLVVAVSEKRLENIILRLHKGDSRAEADVQVMPWRSVVKVVTRDSRCSGTLIAKDLVVTAAHCVVRNGRLLSPSRLAIIAEARHPTKPSARVTKVTIDKRYLSVRVRQQLFLDWALLRITPIVGFLDSYPLISPPPKSPPYIVWQAGYGQDSEGRLRQDTQCRIFEHQHDSGRQLLRHNCLISAGDSGGPLFIEDDGKWRLIGINIAIIGNKSNLNGYALVATSTLP